jgi:hypothetical protein
VSIDDAGYGAAYAVPHCVVACHTLSNNFIAALLFLASPVATRSHFATSSHASRSLVGDDVASDLASLSAPPCGTVLDKAAAKALLGGFTIGEGVIEETPSSHF